METVLLVEDNQRIADNIIRYLGRLDYTVYHRAEAEAALRLVRGQINKFDLLILDIILPRMDGVELCRRLRAARVQLPILMLTNIADTHNIVAALNSGADDYLTKPFALAELAARIQALLRRPARFETRVIKAGVLEINPNTRQVKVAGAPLYLRRREFDLLYYLAKNRNQMLSREQLILNIWSDDDEPFPNTVDSHIRQIRRRLSAIDPSLRNTVQTVYGFGYRFNAPGG